MRHDAGLDVAPEETAIGVVDEVVRIVKAGSQRDQARSKRTGGRGRHARGPGRAAMRPASALPTATCMRARGRL